MMASLPRPPPVVGDSTELGSGSESSFRQSEGSFNSMSTSDSASASDPGEEEFDIEALLKATKRLHAPVWKELHGTPSPLAPPPSSPPTHTARLAPRTVRRRCMCVCVSTVLYISECLRYCSEEGLVSS